MNPKCSDSDPRLGQLFFLFTLELRSRAHRMRRGGPKRALGGLSPRGRPCRKRGREVLCASPTSSPMFGWGLKERQRRTCRVEQPTGRPIGMHPFPAFGLLRGNQGRSFACFRTRSSWRRGVRQNLLGDFHGVSFVAFWRDAFIGDISGPPPIFGSLFSWGGVGWAFWDIEAQIVAPLEQLTSGFPSKSTSHPNSPPLGVFIKTLFCPSMGLRALNFNQGFVRAPLSHAKYL